MKIAIKLKFKITLSYQLFDLSTHFFRIKNCTSNRIIKNLKFSTNFVRMAKAVLCFKQRKLIGRGVNDVNF